MTKVITINIQNNYQMNEGFKNLLETRAQNHIQLKDFVALALEDQTQPLTVAEITIFVNRELNRNYDRSTFRLVLNELVNEGRAVVRTETIAERNLRSEGRSVPGTPSSIYFSSLAGVETPPKRTIAIVVPGSELRSTFGRRPKAKKKIGRPLGSKNRKVTEKPSAKPADSSSRSFDSLLEGFIEERVAIRTRELEAKLLDAEQKLAQLKKLLAS